MAWYFWYLICLIKAIFVTYSTLNENLINALWKVAVGRYK